MSVAHDLATEGIYRAMIEEQGMPKLGTAATLLGIRRGKDIEIDSADYVHRPAFLAGEKNGLSCAATIASLPIFALPLAWGGMNTKTVVWSFGTADLPAELTAVEDSLPGRMRHVSIGPATTMAYDTFARAIESTRPCWKKVIQSGGGHEPAN